ncbi:glycosyltransferase [Pedobacter aquatilis]|uniref:glycosyltransferase n=1 Tax=Pedobacter aquatilis TaxID=351343 RepID=UPI0025B3BE14|nr:glycosyltransferase [Pedobacter aquatilis]MDN3587419.1 glycosyltransferase [Pedobacter aquatilis]
MVFNFLDSSKKTILVIDDDLPQHDKSSGSKRLFEIIKILKNLNFNVIYLPNNGIKISPYYEQLTDLGVDVLLNSPDRNGLLYNLDGLKKHIDFAWISRPILNIEFRKILKSNRKIKIIFDTVDLHFVRMLRQAEKEQNEKLNKKAIKFKKIELNLAKEADATLVVTDTELKLLEQEGINNITVIPNVHALSIPETEIKFENRKGIVFIGGYKHEPNVDAVIWLINEIMPLVWNKLGKIPVYLLGSFPPDEVKNLAGDNVFVPGFLEDVSEYFLNSRIFVAPLRYGAGMKGKIGQSLEFGLPIVSTEIGTEGMNLTHEKNVMLANERKDFADKIIQLYQDANLWHRVKENAYQSIFDYTPAEVSKKLTELFKKLDT